jgi:hypothetical protein
MEPIVLICHETMGPNLTKTAVLKIYIYFIPTRNVSSVYYVLRTLSDAIRQGFSTRISTPRI